MDSNMDTSDNPTVPDSDKPVQERLLNAAEGLFSEHGFYHTSIREIAAVADCNIASVNYYFGGKEKLYVEVWRHNLSIMREKIITSIERVMSEDVKETYLEDLLESFATAFLEPIKDKRKAYQLIKLMDREMVEQNLPKNMFLEEMIMPIFDAMQNALMKVYQSLDKSKTHLFLFSIIGQLVHLIRVQTLYDHSSTLQLSGFDLSETVNHIVRFSAAGIRACAETKEDRGQKTEDRGLKI